MHFTESEILIHVRLSDWIFSCSFFFFFFFFKGKGRGGCVICFVVYSLGGGVVTFVFFFGVCFKTLPQTQPLPLVCVCSCDSDN